VGEAELVAAAWSTYDYRLSLLNSNDELLGLGYFRKTENLVSKTTLFETREWVF
jgi:hypothetical protein